MQPLLAIFLALAALSVAVEAKGEAKKRGLEEATFAYNQLNDFPLGGPVDLGDVTGLGLLGYESLTSSLGGGGLQGLGLLGGGYISGYGLGGGFTQPFLLNEPSAPAPPSTPIATPASNPASGPISIPQPVIPAPAVAQPGPIGAQQALLQGPKGPAGSLLISAPPQIQALPAAISQPPPGRIGSGSLGYASLPNGLVALGSGSLGYSPGVASDGASQAGQSFQLSQGYPGAQQNLLGFYGSQQVPYSSPGSDAAYGGQSLTLDRLSSAQSEITSNLLLAGSGYSGGAGLSLGGLGGGIGLDYSQQPAAPVTIPQPVAPLQGSGLKSAQFQAAVTGSASASAPVPVTAPASASDPVPLTAPAPDSVPASAPASVPVSAPAANAIPAPAARNK